MREPRKLNENELTDEVYLSKIPYVRLGAIAFIVVLLAFFLNFPIKGKIKSAIITAIKGNKSCRMDYSNLNLDLFLRPTVSFKNLIIPGRCLGSRGAGIGFDEVELVLKRPTIVPPGLLFEVKAHESLTDINLLATTGLTSLNFRLDKTIIDSSLLAIAAKLPVKLKGSLSIDAQIDTDYKFPTAGNFHITSKDLNLPPQRIIILDIRGISLAPMLLKGNIQNDVLGISRLQVGNSTTKIEAIFSDGKINLDRKNPNRHMVDVEGKVRLSAELLKEFPILGPFLGSAKMDGNGFYHLKLKGPISALRPQLL